VKKMREKWGGGGDSSIRFNIKVGELWKKNGKILQENKQSQTQPFKKPNNPILRRIW